MSDRDEEFRIPAHTFRLAMPIPQDDMGSIVDQILNLELSGNVTYIGHQVYINRDENDLNGFFLLVHWHPDSSCETDKQEQYYLCFTGIHDFLYERRMLSAQSQ